MGRGIAPSCPNVKPPLVVAAAAVAASAAVVFCFCCCCCYSCSSSEFLTVHVGCDVSVTPDLIEGDVDVGALIAGHYIGGLASEWGRRRRDDLGQSINASTRLPRIASIRPDRPFGVNSGAWSESLHCHIRGGGSSGSASIIATFCSYFYVVVF